MSLEDHVGLHESVEIMYQVSGDGDIDDCYLARLVGGDGTHILAKAEGPTIEEALRRLAEKVG